MEIAWFGSSCFRLRNRNTVAVTDPYLLDPTFQNLQTKTDVTILSNGKENLRKLVPASRESIYCVDGPGEYEIGGIFIRGVPAGNPMNAETGEGTGSIYRLTLDGVNILYMGQLKAPPSQAILDELGAPHILLIPPGRDAALEQTAVVRLVSVLSPSILIPMGYTDLTALENVDLIDSFLRELGQDVPEPVSSLSVRSSNFTSENTQIVQLESRAKLKRPASEPNESPD